MSGTSSSSKKSTEQVNIPIYHAGAHILLAHGPWDALKEIYVDKKLAWIGSASNGTISINKEKLFGGYTREGGIIGDIDILSGSPGQGINSYLSSVFNSANISAYRDWFTIILKQIYLGTNYYFKPWSFKGQRIHVRTNGAAQWQDGLAEVNEPHFYATLTSTLHGIEQNNTTPPETSFTISGANNSSVLEPGYRIQINNELMQVQSLVGNTMTVTRAAYGTEPEAHSIGAAVFGTPIKLINAVHVIRECLTDNKWGLGFLDGYIDETSFSGCAYLCLSEGLGFSWFWRDERNVEEFILDIQAHIQANLYFNRSTQRIHLDPIRKVADVDIPNLLLLDDNNVSEVTGFRRKNLNQLRNTVTVKFKDINTNNSNAVTIDDKSLIYRQGGVYNETKTYSGVRTPAVAMKLAARDLHQLSFPVYSCQIKCNRDAENLQVGSAFRLYWPDYYPAELVMRVTSINLGNNRNKTITIEAVQDVFHAPTVTYKSPPLSLWTDPVSYPIYASLRLVQETPYYVLAKAKGDSFAQSVLTTSSYVVAAAVSPTPDSISTNLWSTSASTFEKKGYVDFCPSGLVAFLVSKTATTVIIASATDFNVLRVGNFIQINSEIMEVILINSLTLTVKRGVMDTVPEVHNPGDRMYAWGTFYGSDQVEWTVGETVKTKLTTITPKGELAVNKAPEDSTTIEGRMHLPYPPGNLKINDLYWPATQPNAALVLTWATRNRFQETATLIDYYTGDITTEVGVTYSGSLIRTDTSAVLASFSGETGTTRTLTPSYVGQVKLSIWSVNANGDSFQTVEHTFSLV